MNKTKLWRHAARGLLSRTHARCVVASVKLKGSEISCQGIRASVDSTINHIIRQSAVTAVTHKSTHQLTQVWKPSVIVQLVLHHIFFIIYPFLPAEEQSLCQKAGGHDTIWFWKSPTCCVFLGTKSATTKELKWNQGKKSASWALLSSNSVYKQVVTELSGYHIHNAQKLNKPKEISL